MTLRLRFSMMISFLFLVLFLGFSLVIYSQVKKKALSEAQSSLKEFTRHEWEHLDLPSHQGGKHEESSHFKNVYVRVWKEGALIFDSFPSKESVTVQDGFDPSQAKIFHTVEGQYHGKKYSVVGYYDVSLLLNSLALFQKVLILGCMGVLVLIFPLAYLLSRELLKPFQFLALKTSELRAEDLHFRFPKSPIRDEYGLLSKNFNDLLDRLETSFSQIKNFAIHASHEIRTPVAVIISQLERAMRKPAQDEEKRRELHEKLLSTAVHLRNILNRLFLLTEIDSQPMQKTQPLEFQIKPIIERVVSDLKEVHAPINKNIQVLPIPSDLTYRGNPDVFESTLLNLIENALKYSHQEVLVSVKGQDGRFEIRVEDDGPGLNQSPDLKNQQKGTGLGLSIVQNYLKSEKSQIQFDKSSLGGLQVRLNFS